MIKQCKGKDLSKVPLSKLKEDGLYYVSIKYDGQYVQIHKSANNVKFFTSGGKQFYLPTIANELVELNPGKDFILECEFIGTSEGKLGDRTKCGILTTWRTEYAKGLTSLLPIGTTFKVFDLISNTPFKERKEDLKHIKLPTEFEVVEFKYCSLARAKSYMIEFNNNGYEGAFCKHENHLYKPGKRVNDAIKLKIRNTADLLCIDIEHGKGKYENLIGALVLKDSKGIVVSVGSGLTDIDRQMDSDYYIGKVIEIEYEQMLDTYIQPTFIRIRNDKGIKECD